jgi:hypothetical protein
LDGEKYVSPARVLLAGMGIDEQLGGYSRHRYNTLSINHFIYLGAGFSKLFGYPDVLFEWNMELSPTVN